MNTTGVLLGRRRCRKVKVARTYILSAADCTLLHIVLLVHIVAECTLHNTHCANTLHKQLLNLPLKFASAYRTGFSITIHMCIFSYIFSYKTIRRVGEGCKRILSCLACGFSVWFWLLCRISKKQIL